MFALLLVTSPMYWFIFIPYDVFKLGKVALVFVIALAYATIYINKLKVSKVTFLIVLALITQVTTSGIVFGTDAERIIAHTYPFIFIAVILSLFTSYLEDADHDDINHLIKIVNLGTIWVLTTVLIIGFTPISVGLPYQHESMTILQGGYGMLRTGWSGGLAVLVVFNCYFLSIGYEKHKRLIYLGLILCFIMQILSGGRGGILTSLIALMMLMFFRKEYIIMLCFVVVSVFLVVLNFEYLIEAMRLDRLNGEYGGVTAGRSTQYVIALRMMIENGFLPLGADGYADEFLAYGIHNSLHNVWLNFAIQYGLLSTIFLVILVVKYVSNSQVGFGSKMILLSGLIPTLFEPSAIFVNVSNYLAWWFILAFNFSFNYQTK